MSEAPAHTYQVYQDGKVIDRECYPSSTDQKAAWEIYVEITTRISAVTYTADCDAREALDSLYKLFQIIRTALAKNENCYRTLKAVLPLSNGKYREFLTYWGARRDSLKADGDGSKVKLTTEFKLDLEKLQKEFEHLLVRLQEILAPVLQERK